jgi:Ferritin-like domain
MHSKIASASLVGLSCLSTIASAAPFTFPLSNGFPKVANPSSQLTAIEQQAHGTLPNGSPPPNITADTETSLELIAFNELFEVAFFTELLSNVTNNVTGFQFNDSNARNVVISALTAVQAQEELHALNANGALAHFGLSPIQPCEYNFPVSDFPTAIALASTFTDVVLGTLQDVASLLATDGDDGLIRGVVSVVGQEGEQNGFYRELLNKTPSALPFLTTSTREFAFSALNQNFIVPGSCPNIGEITLPIFQTLTVDTQNIQPTTQTLQFSVTINCPEGGWKNYASRAPGSGSERSASYYSSLSLVYINQQNLPVVEPITNVSIEGNTVTFDAEFPFDQFLMNGLTIAAVTNTAGPFTSADAVAKDTIFGPGLIEIN